MSAVVRISKSEAKKAVDRRLARFEVRNTILRWEYNPDWDEEQSIQGPKEFLIIEVPEGFNYELDDSGKYFYWSGHLGGARITALMGYLEEKGIKYEYDF